jgi:glycosyltransferase involved in cell wall biosynthesis
VVSWRKGPERLRARLSPGRRRPGSPPVLAARAARAAWEYYRLRRIAGRARARPASTGDRPDLVPSSAPFPKARYCFLVASIPEHPGGRSASILNRARLLKEHADVDCEIVMTHFPGDLDRLTTMLRERGALVPGVTLRRLQDHEAGHRRHARRLDTLSTRRRIHAQLDRMVGDDHVFLTVESRDLDRLLLTYRNPNVQQVYVLHNAHIAPPHRDPQRILRGYRPLMLHHASAGWVLFLTHAQRADMERVLGEQDNFFVIPHAIRPAPPVDPVERDARLVVMLAHLKHQKRVEDAIAAFAQVLERVPDARLEIYGHGPEEERLQGEIDRLGVGSSIRLAGYTDNPGRLYQRAALSLLTSRHEGFPLVLLETLSSGCPPVSYDVKYGPADLIADGVNGVLVEDGDVDAVAQAVTRLLTDHELRDDLSRAAVASVDRLRPDVVAGRWSALFNSLASTAWDPASPGGAAVPGPRTT